MCKFSVVFLTKFDDEDDQDSYKSHSIKAFQTIQFKSATYLIYNYPEKNQIHIK